MISGLPKIPGYTVTHQLGEGGMATVFLATQEKLKRLVAIKILDSSLSRTAGVAQRFVMEARTAASLNHPGIISVYDVGRVDNYFYIIMEFLDGSLRDLLKSSPRHTLEPPEILGYLKKLAPALDYAHGKGVIHRDIKPDNIMFRHDGAPVLVDFGIARAADANSHMTKTGMSIGTPHYMSPEQCKAEAIDGRTDYYSLGVVLYEAFTGDKPFDADTTVGVALKHLQSSIPALPPHLSQFQFLLNKLLAKNKEDRVKNGAELIALIDKSLNPDRHNEVWVRDEDIIQIIVDEISDDLTDTLPPIFTPAPSPAPTPAPPRQSAAKTAPTTDTTPIPSFAPTVLSSTSPATPAPAPLPITLPEPKPITEPKPISIPEPIPIPMPELELEPIPERITELMPEGKPKPPAPSTPVITSQTAIPTPSAPRPDHHFLTKPDKIFHIPYKIAIPVFAVLMSVIFIWFFLQGFLVDKNDRENTLPAHNASKPQLTPRESAVPQPSAKLPQGQTPESTPPDAAHANPPDETGPTAPITPKNKNNSPGKTSPPPNTNEAIPPNIPKLSDNDAFQEAKTIGTVESYRQYLKDYPTGKHQDEAMILIQQIADSAAVQAIEKKQGASNLQLRTVYMAQDTSDVEAMTRQYGFFDSALNARGKYKGKLEIRDIAGQKVIADLKSGLMWHYGGSESELKYSKVKGWLKDLNKAKYAGFSDWRVPTVEEAASLLRPIKGDNGLYTDSLFSAAQKRIWTGDSFGSGDQWVVRFYSGLIYTCPHSGEQFVRPVRSMK